MLTVMQLLDYSNALNYCIIEKNKKHWILI